MDREGAGHSLWATAHAHRGSFKSRAGLGCSGGNVQLQTRQSDTRNTSCHTVKALKKGRDWWLRQYGSICQLAPPIERDTVLSHGLCSPPFHQPLASTSSGSATTVDNLPQQAVLSRLSVSPSFGTAVRTESTDRPWNVLMPFRYDQPSSAVTAVSLALQDDRQDTSSFKRYCSQWASKIAAKKRSGIAPWANLLTVFCEPFYGRLKCWIGHKGCTSRALPSPYGAPLLDASRVSSTLAGRWLVIVHHAKRWDLLQASSGIECLTAIYRRTNLTPEERISSCSGPARATRRSAPLASLPHPYHLYLPKPSDRRNLDRCRSRPNHVARDCNQLSVRISNRLAQQTPMALDV